jgi:PKD domain
MLRNVRASRKFLAPTLLVVLISVSFLVPVLFPSNAQTPFCPGNLLKNGDFSTGIVVVGSGNFPPSTVPSWSSAFGSTPQISAGPGCNGNPGFISMWGNKTVGEAIQQSGLNIQVGHTYKLSACVKWLNNNPSLPNYVRFNVRASIGNLTSYSATPPPGSQIGVTSNITSTNWTSITLPNWMANAAYNTITINPENDNTANDGNTVSWGQIDSICLQEVFPPDFKATTVCLGTPTTFNSSVTGASSWDWDFGDGSPHGNQQNPTHQYMSAGSFNVKLCINGTTNCITKPVIVNAPPPAPVITGPASSCGNQTATYSVPAAPGLSYSWTATNGTINGSSTGSSVSITWNGANTGVVSVTVTNKAGCSSTKRMEVIGCNLGQGDCCMNFQAKTDLKSLVDQGNGVYDFTATLSVGPNIIRVVADVVSTTVTYSPTTCGTAGPINGYLLSAGNVSGFSQSLLVPNGHVAIWQGSGATVSGLDFPMQIHLPPPPTNSHCFEYVTICVKYTFLDKNCKSCEVIHCYGPFRRGGLIKFPNDLKEITDLKAVEAQP